MTVLPSTGDDTVNVNTDGVGVANAVFNSTRRIGAINIGAGGVATLTNGGAKVLTTRSLNITGTGKQDLTNNSLILDYTGASPIATIRSLIANGFNGGAWNGAGIVTSRGDAANFGLGYGEAPGVAPGGTFGGQAVDGAAVVVTFTIHGDANLDKTIDRLDFNALAGSFGRTNKIWANSDFNYDGAVDTLDFNMLAVNFGRSDPAAAPTMAAAKSDRLRKSPVVQKQDPIDLLPMGIMWPQKERKL